MTNRRVLQFPDSDLREVSSPVEDFGESLQNLVTDLVDTLEVQGGAGLAAPQIGERKRVLIIRPDAFDVDNPDPYDGNQKYMVLVNPELNLGAEETAWKEACLSVASPPAVVTRHSQCSVKYKNHMGEDKSLDLDWPLSGALQHENDHLDGKLFIDRLSPVARDIVVRKIRKHRKQLRIAMQQRLRREQIEATGTLRKKRAPTKRKKRSRR